MLRQNLLLSFFAFFISCYQTKHAGNEKNNNKFSIGNTIKKYKQLLEMKESDYSNVSIDTGTIKLITENEMVRLDSFDLYRFTIFNGGHYEYNSGHIYCLGLVSKSDTNDIRILFPMSYAKSSLNFYEPYFNKVVPDKKNYCSKLSNLINYFTTYQVKNIEYDYFYKDKFLTVIAKHIEPLYNINSPKIKIVNGVTSIDTFSLAEKNATVIKRDTVQFTFNGDTLKSFLKIDKK